MLASSPDSLLGGGDVGSFPPRREVWYSLFVHGYHWTWCPSPPALTCVKQQFLVLTLSWRAALDSTVANGGGPNWNTALSSSLPCKWQGGGGRKKEREKGDRRNALELLLLPSCRIYATTLTCKCVFIPEPSKSLNALYCINLGEKMTLGREGKQIGLVFPVLTLPSCQEEGPPLPA